MAATAIAACAPTPPPAPTPTPAPSPSAAAQAANTQRLTGKVASVASGKVTLDSGKTFTLAADTRILRAMAATMSDLKVGDYVAVTAKRQPDDTLLASMINVFAPSQRGIAAGQFPIAGGNLMTNATIDRVDANGIGVSFPNGNAVVKIAPDAKLMKLVEATAADVKEGVSVSAVVAGDVARSVTITEASA
jgi:Cu/Ag efflux protein CusF